jgi:hypothetical protein
MRLPILPSTLLALLFLAMASYGDADGSQYQSSSIPHGRNLQDEEDGADQADAQEDATEQEASQSGGTADSTTYNKFTVCSNAAIQVLDIQVACDSPGTFYYGSGKYRNSPTCLPGDKAKVLIDLYIADPDTIQSAGGSIIIDARASASGGWYQQNHGIFEDADLCSLSSLQKKSGSGCPYQGTYRIQTSFYWEDVQYDYLRNAFYPTLMVGLKSTIGMKSYNLGGANTVYCTGSTFSIWSTRLRTTYANAISNFMKSFGILLFTIVIMGVFVWFLVQRPTSVRDAGQKMGVIKRDIVAEDEFDFSKMKSPHNGQNLVDF